MILIDELNITDNVASLSNGELIELNKISFGNNEDGTITMKNSVGNGNKLVLTSINLF